jgi:hypothetical protein
MADAIIPVDAVASSDYILPVTHASVERVGTVVRMTMAMQQTGCRAVGLSALTTPEFGRLMMNLPGNLAESSQALQTAMKLERPALPVVDFEFDPLAPPQFVVNALAYVVEERGAVFVDLFSSDPSGLIKAQSRGGAVRIGVVRVAMAAGMFLAWINAIEKAAE